MTKQPETPRHERAPAAGVHPPAAGRMNAEDRRRQIAQVAMRLFAERGFRGTTTKEIAQAAGVSEAIIFRHFATKEELYAAIIDHKACAGGGTFMGGPAPGAPQCPVAEAMRRRDDRAVFRALALEVLSHHEQDPQLLRLLLYSALEGHQLGQMFWDRVVREMYAFIGSYVRERQREGVFRDVDPLVVVRAFSGMIIHHSVTNILWDKKRTLLDISNEGAAHEFTEILLKGITNSAAARRGAAAAPGRAPAGARAGGKK